MKVVAYDPFVSAERFRELGVEPATFGEVLERAEFLTLHLPLTDDTRNVINAARSPRCATAFGSSNARAGELLDEAALVAALQSGRSPAPRSDVFSTEPYDGPLLRAPNIVVTPTLPRRPRRRRTRGSPCGEQVAAALDGGLVTNAVNIPSVGAEDLEVLGRSCRSREKLGRLAMELAAARRGESGSRSTASSPRDDTEAPDRRRPERAFQGNTDHPVTT